jgi:hypothetical protein
VKVGGEQARLSFLKAHEPPSVKVAVEGRPPRGYGLEARIRNAEPGFCKQQLLETKYCGQRLWAGRAEKSRLNAPNRLLRPVFRAQATEMSRYFWPWEIKSVCADFLVERRGFKLMVIVA